MTSRNEYTCELRIENPLGFHVRPVQRFAELAQAFKSDITVEIDGREASGKSVMGLMSLGGRYGATMRVTTKGPDARQALDVIRYLVREDFFVEDTIEPGQRPRRHIDRLKNLVSFFDSDVHLVLDGREIGLNSEENLRSLEFSPTDDVEFEISGDDEQQASYVLQRLVNYKFYVEEAMSSTPE